MLFSFTRLPVTKCLFGCCFFLLGDSFYSYIAPDKVLSLLVLKLSRKRFPLPVQR